MLKSVSTLLAMAFVLTGCNAFQPEENTREVVIGDCLNGAVVNQATFGGPIRCGPQSEPVFTDVTPATDS